MDEVQDPNAAVTDEGATPAPMPATEPEADPAAEEETAATPEVAA